MDEARQRSMAEPGREAIARDLFPVDSMTPEEYAAREAHHWMSFSFDNYRYSDPRLDRWVQRLGDIFFRRPGAPAIDELRAELLTDEERRQIEAEEKDF